MGYMPLGFAYTLIGTFVITMIYARSYSGGSRAAEGARFGLLMGIFVVCTFVGHNCVTLNIDGKLALEPAASTLVQWMVVGIVMGLIYKPPLAGTH